MCPIASIAANGKKNCHLVGCNLAGVQKCAEEISDCVDCNEYLSGCCMKLRESNVGAGRLFDSGHAQPICLLGRRSASASAPSAAVIMGQCHSFTGKQE